MTLKNHVGMFCTIFLHFQKHCDFLKITILAANVVISRFVIQFANLFVQNENIIVTIMDSFDFFVLFLCDLQCSPIV